MIFGNSIEERFSSGHSAIKYRWVECCSDGCPSGGFSNLHTGSVEHRQNDHHILGHRLPRPFSPDCSLAGRVALGRVLVVGLPN